MGGRKALSSLLFALTAGVTATDSNGKAMIHNSKQNKNRNKDPVKIFLLAGDDAAEGYASVDHLREIYKKNSTKGRYAHLFQNGSNTAFLDRDDVFIAFDPLFTNQSMNHGPLTVEGRSNFGATPTSFGPEVEMGHVLGNVFEEPVVIIKATYSGKTLADHFKAPTKRYSGGKPGNDAGDQYFHILRSVKQTIDHLAKILKGTALHHYKSSGNKHVFAGVVWFHGYSDFQDDDMRSQYEANLRRLLQNLRIDLTPDRRDAEALPIVVAQLGGQGPKPSQDEQLFRYMQQRVTSVSGNATSSLARIARYYRPLNNLTSRSILRATNATNVDYAHYYTRADTMIDIGAAFASELLTLGYAEKLVNGNLPVVAPGHSILYHGINHYGSHNQGSKDAAPSGSGDLLDDLIDRMHMTGTQAIIVLLAVLLSLFVCIACCTGAAYHQRHSERKRRTTAAAVIAAMNEDETEVVDYSTSTSTKVRWADDGGDLEMKELDSYDEKKEDCEEDEGGPPTGYSAIGAFAIDDEDDEGVQENTFEDKELC